MYVQVLWSCGSPVCHRFVTLLFMQAGDYMQSINCPLHAMSVTVSHHAVRTSRAEVMTLVIKTEMFNVRMHIFTNVPVPLPSVRINYSMFFCALRYSKSGRLSQHIQTGNIFLDSLCTYMQYQLWGSFFNFILFFLLLWFFFNIIKVF